jgi:hypothetical protein
VRCLKQHFKSSQESAFFAGHIGARLGERMTTRTHFAHRIDTCDADGAVIEHLASIEDFFVIAAQGSKVTPEHGAKGGACYRFTGSKHVPRLPAYLEGGPRSRHSMQMIFLVRVPARKSFIDVALPRDLNRDLIVFGARAYPA